MIALLICFLVVSLFWVLVLEYVHRRWTERKSAREVVAEAESILRHTQP